MTIPPFLESGNLPEGVHEATWEEIVDRYGATDRRRELLEGLRAALDSLRDAGCPRAYIDGSFVTSKNVPGDFDACWETASVDPDLLDPVLLTFTNQREEQKARFGGELFPAELGTDPHGTRFLDFFQQDKVTGERKGIVSLDLEGSP